MASRKAETVRDARDLELEVGPWGSDGMSRTMLESGVEVRLPDVIPGEEHRVRITHRSKGGPVLWAESLALLAPGPAGKQRRLPPCPIHGACGACGIQHVNDAAQLPLKVESALAVLPESLRRVVQKPAQQDDRRYSFGYRHKAVFLPAVADGRLLLGGFRRGSHEVIDLPDCAVLAPALAQARGQLLEALGELLVEQAQRVAAPGTSPKQEGAAAALRCVIARANRLGEVLLCAVVNDHAARLWLEAPLAKLVAQPGPIVGCSMQVFSSAGDAVAGSAPEIHLSGHSTIREELGAAALQLRPLDFFQVNPFALSQLSSLLNERLLSLPERPLRVLDLYCGGGALGLALAAAAPGEVLLTGLDIDARAISSARRDAQANSIEAVFESGAAADLLPVLMKERGPFDVVIVDPPRRGLRPEATEEILSTGAKSLFYLSCHSPSLARDAQLLEAGGYRITALWPVDMLPQTPHLEWLAAFVREASEG